MDNVQYQRFVSTEDNNQQPLLSPHQPLRSPPTPPSLVQNLHLVPCPSRDQVPAAGDPSVAGLPGVPGVPGSWVVHHDKNCALNAARRNNNTTDVNRAPAAAAAGAVAAAPTDSSDVAQESVDLLRMLPEARGSVHPQQQQHRESNPRRANRMYGPTPASALLQPTQGPSGSGAGAGTTSAGATAGATAGSSSLHREAEESAAEDSSGFCDDSVVYYTSIPCTHANAATRSLLGGSAGGSSSATGGATSDPEERIAFLSGTYSTLSRHKRNNGGAGISLIEDRAQRGASSGVAEYCTSKSHSRSCGNLTCPRYDKNRLGRSLKQIYPDYKNKRKKQLKNVKRWTFLTAIFIGIILAITGIIVAFLVYAPFHLGSKCIRSATSLVRTQGWGGGGA